MSRKEITEARKMLRMVREARKKAECAPPPTTLEEELMRQDDIAKRAAVTEKCLQVLEIYRARRREAYQAKREARKGVQHAKS